MILDVPTTRNFRMDIAGATGFVFSAASLQVGFDGGGTNLLMFSDGANSGYIEMLFCKFMVVSEIVSWSTSLTLKSKVSDADTLNFISVALE